MEDNMEFKGNTDNLDDVIDTDANDVAIGAVLKLGALVAGAGLAVKGAVDLVKERVEAHREKKAGKPEKAPRKPLFKKTKKKEEEPAKESET